MVYVYVCMLPHLYVGMHVYVHLYMCRHEIDAQYLPQLLYTVYIAAMSLI